jgi:dTDP-glucose 4,6-dehydratase
LDKLTYAGNLENLKDVEKNPNYKFVKGDICDLNLVIKTISENNIDTIVNFAAQTHVDRSILNVKRDNSDLSMNELFNNSLENDFVLNNVWGTHILLEAAVKSGNIRFHHISTDEVFGSLESKDAPFNEKTSYDPRSPYSASKAASDHLVRSYYHTFGLPITISNCSNNYGPYQFPEKLIPFFITNLLEGKKVPLYGDGLNVRDWIHVDDHNRGVDLILQKGKIGETYCLGGASEKTNLEITKFILNEFGKGEEMIEYIKDRAGHDRRYAIDFSKIKKELGWEPQIKFADGLKQTIEWYKNNKEWWKKIKSGEYQDYYKKQYEKR